VFERKTTIAMKTYEIVHEHTRIAVRIIKYYCIQCHKSCTISEFLSQTSTFDIKIKIYLQSPFPKQNKKYRLVARPNFNTS